MTPPTRRTPWPESTPNRGALVSNAAEVAALEKIGQLYARWGEVHAALSEQMKTASDTGASPPVEALRDDFQSGVAVVRAAIEFGRVCSVGGPDLEGLAGRAFVQALYQSARDTDLLAGELEALEAEFADWLPRVGAWTPAAGAAPPRPTRPGYSAVLAAVDGWQDCLWENEHDRLIQLVAGDRPVTKTVGVTEDGRIIQKATVSFSRDDDFDAAPSGGSWWSRLWRRPPRD